MLVVKYLNDLQAVPLPVADGDVGGAVLGVVEVPSQPVHSNLPRPDQT
jgi:hypothetical protein